MSETKKNVEGGNKKRRISVRQSNFPALPLNKAMRIAQCLWDDFAGGAAAPHDIAIALDVSPTSGPWRELVGASSAYGLTKGTYTSNEIVLNDIGRRIVGPEEEGQDLKARVEAVLRPTIMAAFFRKYDKAKFPQDTVAENVLLSLGLPKERCKAGVVALKDAGRTVGIIRDTKTGPFVAIDLPPSAISSGQITPISELEESDVPAMELSDHEEIAQRVADGSTPNMKETVNNKVFISHGKNMAIVEQIQELLKFGKFEPVLSVNRESTAIPVPDKVFEDMRGCHAGVIHVRSEGELLDANGDMHTHINDNVLIEIGAAIALYKKNVILLVEKNLQLPSNLQGLYRCEYEGETLDYDATMKLLKTFNKFE